MKNYKFICVSGLLIMFLQPMLYAQFLTQGTITFERTINLKQYANFEKEVTSPDKDNAPRAGKSNIVYTAFDKKVVLAQKNVYSTDLVITDSIRHFKWKIEGEMRPIAGFLCRKATTIICDSVVVVAFYTTSILVKGGPESFSGLPGMIMGLVIPRLRTTWFATNVSPLNEKILFKPSTKKAKTYNEINEIMDKQQRSPSFIGSLFRWWVFL